MIDTDKYEGHTPAPWLELEVDKVVAYQFDENDNPKMICNVFRDGDGGSAYEGGWGDNEVEANQKLIADAPLLLAEVKRLRSLDDLLRSMEKDGITASGYDHLLSEVKQLREQLAKANKYVHSICQHSDSMLMDYEDYMKGDD